MNTSIQQVSYSKMVTQLNPNQAFALNAILVGRVTSIGAHGSMSAIQIPTFNLVYHMRAEKNKHAEVWKKNSFNWQRASYRKFLSATICTSFQKIS